MIVSEVSRDRLIYWLKQIINNYPNKEITDRGITNLHGNKES